MESDDQALMHQLMLERMQRCEEALDRAQKGTATDEDWQVIRFECGLGKKEQQNGISG